jgi:hypothetical protein
MVQPLDTAEEVEARFGEGGIYLGQWVRSGGEVSTRYMWMKQCRCRYRNSGLPSMALESSCII